MCPRIIGVDQRDVVSKIQTLVPDYMAMGERGMAEMGEMEMPLPDNTLPMMTGTGPFGALEMGGMFSVVKVRDNQGAGDYSDPGWYQHPTGTVAYEWTGQTPPPVKAARHAAGWQHDDRPQACDAPTLIWRTYMKPLLLMSLAAAVLSAPMVLAHGDAAAHFARSPSAAARRRDGIRPSGRCRQGHAHRAHRDERRDALHAIDRRGEERRNHPLRSSRITARSCTKWCWVLPTSSGSTPS